MKTKKCLIDKGDVYQQVETALCIWEYVIEGASSLHNNEKLYTWMTEEEGVFHGRMNCANIAWLFDVAYETGQAGEKYRLDGHAFDWEIVPAILDAFVAMFDSPTQATIEAARQVGETLPTILKPKEDINNG